MPLQASWSFNNNSRVRMATAKGHYVRVKRPSGPELYEDASRILDQLLQKHLTGEFAGRGRPARYRTHPGRMKSSGETIDERDELDLEDSGIERSKTMPSRMRGASRDEALKPKDLDTIERQAKRRFSRGNGSVSSADTEGDSSDVSKHRKKKSMLQKAKSRFLHALHRDEREKKLTDKVRESPKSSPKSSPKKVKKKEKDKSIEKNGIKLSPQKGDKQGKDDGHDKRRNTAGQVFLNTIRRSFSIKRERRSTPPDGSGDRAQNAASSTGTSGSSKSPTPSPEKYSTAHSHLGPSSYESKHPSALSVPGRKDSSVSPSPSPFPHSSSTESHHTGGDKSSSLYSFASTHQYLPNGSNVLDAPGEDIPFMDGDSDVGNRGVKKPATTRQYSLVPDGDSENDVHDGKGSNPALEGDVEGIPFHERTKEEKDELYGKIAQKLIHIGESYAAESGISDSDLHSREPAGQAAAGDSAQTDLERAIMECLRDIGDRNSSVVDEHAQQMVEKAKAETYQRFKSTVQHSLGEEVSWNHLAFLFYTTKGVVTAVGKGSRMAGDVKEMTLRYFSDRFAKWIMDQGGFDSLLSDTDSELD